ncbi:MAG: hypothetical protein ACE5EX_02775 [Phycisphaerae bacterium]
MPVRGYIADKPGVRHDAVDRMFYEDLERARAAWIADANNLPDQDRRRRTNFLPCVDATARVADPHTRPGTLATVLPQAGVPPQVTMRIMRHAQCNRHAAPLRQFANNPHGPGD